MPPLRAEPFYDGYAPQEWERLKRYRTEFAVTMRALGEFLPPPPCAILDEGGGPGRYSIELARRGYRVTLLDVSGESLRLARQKAQEAQVALQAIVHADALDLSALEDASFDAVLLMGPLYHLLSHEERSQAIHEALRVLRPGGRLFAAFITRFAPFRYQIVEDPAWLAANPAYARQLLETGVHDQPTAFALAYYVHPGEVVPLMEGCGLDTLRLLGCEGVAAERDDRLNELTGQAWEAWVDLNYKLGQEPSLYGASDHLLYVGEKPDSHGETEAR